MSLLRYLATLNRMVVGVSNRTSIVAPCGSVKISFNPVVTSRRRTLTSSGALRKATAPSATTRATVEPNRAKFAQRIATSPTPKISEASVDAARSRVVVRLDDADGALRYEFPAVWLRDNCQCERCFHTGSSSRVLDWERFDVAGVKVSQVRVSDAGRSLEVLWNDGSHRSVYGLQWLLERSFEEERTLDYLHEWYRPRPVVWGADGFGAVLKEFAFEEVLADDGVLRQWIEALIAYGVVMIKGAPLTEHECRRLANRVGFIRKTHYGEEFIVKAKEGTSNVAYLSTPLQMHTDLPYYDYKPGCNLLHCLVQSTNTVGGENLIADGFYVAEYLRQHHPDDFRVLSETLVDWSDLGSDEAGSFHSLYRAPVICVGRDGRLERINHSVPQRDSRFCVPIDRVEPWYRAMKRFVTVLHREAVSFKTAPGDILTFSNVRMVHGRTGYTDTAGNTRHIVGAYLDWDEIYSKLRVLKASSSEGE
uniref:Gamma-butyrobetaine dioxygenase n=1 Tax=Anopheles dirus TaxID=7168 RepID=A0A182NU35_9DIPT